MKIEAGKYIGRVLKRGDTDYQKRINQVFKLRHKEMICEYNNKKNGDGIDCDEYDKYCDHAIVIDTLNDEVVGTYRFIKKEHVSNINNRFLLESEFNIDELKNKNLLEVGRAVVSKEHRDGSVLLILWKEALHYAINQNIDIMLGTASFHGINPEVYLNSLLYIKNKYSSEYNCYAINNVYEINDICDIDETKVRKEIPPLIKGYIRMGSKFGKNVYIDYDFHSCDVLVITEIKNIDKRYFHKFAN